MDDRIHWNHPREVDFSVKSAYKLVAEEEQPTLGNLWRLIWKSPGNQRTRTFMWMCSHNKLFTNVQRWKRKFTSDSLCGRCRITEESVIHALRDCLTIKDLWKMLVNPIFWLEFFRGDTTEWLRFNNKREIGKLEGPNWKLTFGEAICRTWLMCNNGSSEMRNMILPTSIGASSWLPRNLRIARRHCDFRV